MTDKTNPDGAAEREELLDELEENHERARREAADSDIERRAREAKPEGKKEPERKHHDEENPPHTTTGRVTSPKFGSAGSGGAEYEGNLKKN